MFEHWPPQFDPPCRREVQPPRPVRVDLGAVLPPAPPTKGALPMRVRAGGLSFTGQTDGVLLAWARTTQGAWLGLVRCTVRTANGQGSVELQQWVPDHALSPASG